MNLVLFAITARARHQHYHVVLFRMWPAMMVPVSGQPRRHPTPRLTLVIVHHQVFQNHKARKQQNALWFAKIIIAKRDLPFD